MKVVLRLVAVVAIYMWLSEFSLSGRNFFSRPTGSCRADEKDNTEAVS